MSEIEFPSMEWRARIHARLKPANYKSPELVKVNLYAAIPKAGARPISANQIFKTMKRPRARSMRHAEQMLDWLVQRGRVEIVMSGYMTLYRFAA